LPVFSSPNFTVPQSTPPRPKRVRKDRCLTTFFSASRFLVFAYSLIAVRGSPLFLFCPPCSFGVFFAPPFFFPHYPFIAHPSVTSFFSNVCPVSALPFPDRRPFASFLPFPLFFVFLFGCPPPLLLTREVYPPCLFPHNTNVTCTYYLFLSYLRDCLIYGPPHGPLFPPLFALNHFSPFLLAFTIFPFSGCFPNNTPPFRRCLVAPYPWVLFTVLTPPISVPPSS